MSEHAEKVIAELDRPMTPQEEVAYHKQEADDAHGAYRTIAKELAEERRERQAYERESIIALLRAYRRINEVEEQLERARDFAALLASGQNPRTYTADRGYQAYAGPADTPPT